jgi:hypothetical protein
MIVQVSRTDENGLYKEPVLLEEGQEVPINCIVDIVPEGLYLPKWDGTQWVEGLTLEAINRLKNTDVWSFMRLPSRWSADTTPC